MKKRNKKILSLALALSLNFSLIIDSFTMTAFADTVSESQNQNINIKLESSDNVSAAANNFTLTNKGDAVDLSKVKLRYYFTSDENSDGQAFACYYSCVSGLKDKNNNITDYVHGSFVKLDNPIENADSYLEISFDEDAGTFDSSDVLTLNTAVNNNNWSKVNTDDDYSFNDAAKTVVLVNDEVVSGTAPVSKEDMLPKVTLGGVTVKGGETVKVPVNISNLRKKGVSKFHLKVAYDSDIFEFGGCFSQNPEITKLGYAVETGRWHNSTEHTADIGYDFTKAKDTKAFYEECDYVYLPLKAANNIEDGVSYLKIIAEPTLTDDSGNEYSGDSINFDNEPITLKYNKDAVKDSYISQNYLTFDENTVKDTDITMKKYENIITSIECLPEDYDRDEDYPLLNSDIDFEVSDSTLTLKESFLKTLLGKNYYLTINFNQGMSQTIFVNNTKLKTVSDPLRSGINNNEANVSVGDYSDHVFTKDSPLTFSITNTSNIDMDLDKLKFTYYYRKTHPETIDNFTLEYCSILGSNKDMRSVSIIEARPIYCDWYWNKRCFFEQSFNKNAGVLKPGETLILRGHLTPEEDDTLRLMFQKPVVTYEKESIYSDLPEEFLKDSKILTDNIVLDSTNNSSIPVELQLNSNALESIDAYSEGNHVKTLKKGTDYIHTKRNEIILSKSYLDSIKKNTTLSFKFSSGHDASINISIKNTNKTLPDGTLTIENTASTAYGETGLCGGTYPNRWNDLIVPITINDTQDEAITSYSLILKFNKYLFNDVKVDSDYGSIYSSEVNYELGIIKINLNDGIIFNNDEYPDFNLIFSPNGNTMPQKIELSLDSDSYYETESGDMYKPVFKYNDIELISKNRY